MSGSVDTFDYIIVGAGSAGCVLADRLTACGRYRVLLLEAGGSDRRPWIRLPIGYGRSFHDGRVNWRFTAQPAPGLGGRALYWPRGKVLGGSSSVNGLVWMRGLPCDFDGWAQAGNPGWDAAAVEPVFDRIEDVGTKTGTKTGTETGAETGARTGSAVSGGRVCVTDRSREYHAIRRFYLDAAREAGLTQADPGRIHREEGAGPYRITTRRGLRHSAADAFLRPAMRRRNLEVRTGVTVDRIAFTGKRADAVHYLHAGRAQVARARSAVILAAGTVGSPAILQRSGIGPATILADHGIAPVHVNASVGGGLQDHLGVDYFFRTAEPTLNQVLGTLRGQVSAAIRFLLCRRGPLSLSVNQMGGLVRSRPDVALADLQLYFNPLSYTTQVKNRRPLLRPDPWPGFAFGFNACRPTSRGRVDIASADPAAAPRIAPNYLSTNGDIATAIAGGRLIERMLGTSAMRALITAPNGFNPTGAADAEILADFRARASTVFHACGTCRMAPEADGGVVDPALRVYGVEGLRVVDASIFPNITSANTNAPTIMVAAKAADMILAG